MGMMKWTVNEALRAAPQLVETFHRMGIDTCCGGTLTLAEAAGAAGLTPEELAVALGPALRGLVHDAPAVIAPRPATR